MSVVTPNNWGGIYVGIYIERQMQDPLNHTVSFAAMHHMLYSQCPHQFVGV